jgi:hypothetical protein
MRKQNHYYKLITFILLISITFIFSFCRQQPVDLKSQLGNIAGAKLSIIEADAIYKEAYELWYKQNIDHDNPKGGTFSQRVIINHVGFDRPTVVILEGYNIFTTRAGELSTLLNANQITIEHRFFDKSRPDYIPWEFLNVKQAAIDHHKIIESLKDIYRGKWISTGISKGGQTTMFHRRFFPDDVHASVLYVAPLNFEREDPRIEKHLNSVGTKECRDKIYKFQIELFKKKDIILPLLKEYVEEKEYPVSLAEIERAYDLNILEYSFGFWQWSGNCYRIPDKNASEKEMFDHWKSTAPFSFFCQKDTTDILFTYQALCEIGFYDYNIAPFQKYLEDTVNITFDYKIPKGVTTSYDPEIMQDINDWLQKDGDYMLYIYGENDPWAATAVNPSNNTIAVKMVNPNGNHRTRISSFPDYMKDSIYHTLETWLKMKLPENSELW